MRRPHRIGVSLAAVTSLLGVGLVTSSTAQAAPVSAQDYAGCTTGYVCIYPDDSWNNSDPEHTYYTYGVHPLYNEYDFHRVFNNQYGGATARLCVNSNGTDCTSKIGEYTYRDIDLTPYNSIRLDPS
ncbi:hypothetical protein [Streptomyces sp. GSL17-111]|uniref:hypothetical protein n=1 Tax=Streptomyces sp. GSL17-111 TaxID=3121596 RepID=UPI0030F463B0